MTTCDNTKDGVRCPNEAVHGVIGSIEGAPMVEFAFCDGCYEEVQAWFAERGAR